MVGNPVMFCTPYGLDATGYYPLQFNRYFYDGLISYVNYAKWGKLGCNDKVTNECVKFFNHVQNEIGVIDQQLRVEMTALASANQPDLDPDDLFQDFCSGNGTLNQAHLRNEQCAPIGDLTISYFNRADVQASLHAKAGTTWSVCTDGVNYDTNLADEGLIPFLKDIFKLKPELHILYYSGDVDVDTVPTQITQACLSQLEDVVTTKKTWSPWRVNGWHAGYAETYDRYTFATVKGAGHEVPTYQPFLALNMFQRFLQTQTLDDVQGVTVKSLPRHRRQSDSLKQLLKQL